MEVLKLKAVFGIQDFIHFVKNLRYHHGNEFSPDVVMKCLEENFNGVEPDVFNKICASFLRAVSDHNIYTYVPGVDCMYVPGGDCTYVPGVDCTYVPGVDCM